MTRLLGGSRSSRICKLILSPTRKLYLSSGTYPVRLKGVGAVPLVAAASMAGGAAASADAAVCGGVALAAAGAGLLAGSARTRRFTSAKCPLEVAGGALVPGGGLARASPLA